MERREKTNNRDEAGGGLVTQSSESHSDPISALSRKEPKGLSLASQAASSCHSTGSSSLSLNFCAIQLVVGLLTTEIPRP